jgi:hypothetical protein
MLAMHDRPNLVGVGMACAIKRMPSNREMDHDWRMRKFGDGLWRATAVMGLGCMAFGLSACDPGHPFDNVQVKIFSNGDGFATMSATVQADSVDGSNIDEASFLSALASELAIGAIAGPARVPPDRDSSSSSIQFENVDRGKLTVSLTAVLSIMDQFGLRADTTVFVSVCTSALSGTASGTGVELAHRSSCATWEPRPRPADTDAFATLSFASRGSPAGSSIILALVVAVFAIAGGVVYFAASDEARKAGLACSILAIMASLAVAGFAVVSGVRLSDTWFDTGQTFDDQIASGFRTTVAVALVAGMAAPLAILTAGGVLHRRRESNSERL